MKHKLVSEKLLWKCHFELYTFFVPSSKAGESLSNQQWEELDTGAGDRDLVLVLIWLRYCLMEQPGVGLRNDRRGTFVYYA